MSGWALVRRGALARSARSGARRWVVLSSGTVCVYESPDTRTHSVVVVLNGASASTNPAKLEAVVKGPDGSKIAFVWPTAEDLTAFKAAFDFANRVLDDRFQTVGDRVLTKRNDCEVLFGFDKATGEHCAIKVITKDQRSRQTVAECEVAIRMAINHRAIVRTVDVFETPFDLFLVMDYMDGGSLAGRINSRTTPPITEHDAQVIMLRLFSALTYLHARGIVHRNIKPENILYQSPDDDRWATTVRLSDFRKACYLHPHLAPSPSAAEYSNLIVGTPDYLAPESAGMMTDEDGTRRPCLGAETDMWAAGVTLYNILSNGALPFYGTTTPEVLRNARHTAVSFDQHPAFGQVTESAMSLIRALLNPDRRKRPTAESVLYHPWFNCLDECAGQNVRQPSLLFGVHKFRAAVTSVRFLARMCAVAPGCQKVVLSSSRSQPSSSQQMHYVTKVAPVDVVPGVNISNGAVGGGFQGMQNLSQDLPPPATGVPCPLSGIQFTTSTLGPSDQPPQVLRTSHDYLQTSSLGSQSFRSSYDDSHVRFAAPDGQPPSSPRTQMIKQQEDARQRMPLDHQAAQQQQQAQYAALLQTKQVEQDVVCEAEAHRRQDEHHRLLQEQHMAAIRLQQQQQYRQAEKQALDAAGGQSLIEQQQMAQAAQSHSQQQQQLHEQQMQNPGGHSGGPGSADKPTSGGGFMGTIFGAMRRDTDESPHNSNGGSRAGSHLAALHFQELSHRAHMKPEPLLTQTRDQSMGSVSSSPAGSNRSPHEAGGVVHDPLGMMVIDGLEHRSRGASAHSGMELADPLATDWPEFDPAGRQSSFLESPHDTVLRFASTIPNIGAPVDGSSTGRAQSPGGTPGKDKKSFVKKKFEHISGFFK